jgi:cytochrome P450
MSSKPHPGPRPVRPWPLGLPLLRAVQRDPLGMMEHLHARQGDTVHLHVLSTHLYYLFRPELVRKVLVDHQADFVKDERILRIFQSVHGPNVITTDGAVWERQRRMLAPAFGIHRIEGYAGLMAEAADESMRLELPARAGDSALVDVDRLTTRITMDVILRALFTYRGSRDEAESVSLAVRALSRQIMREFFWPLRPVPGLPYPGRREKLRNLATLRRLIAPLIEARRNHVRTGGTSGDDMLGLFLAARDVQSEPRQAALSDREIYDNCVGLFGAGHDTSATALTWWMGLMAAHPDVAGQVRGEVCAQVTDDTRDRGQLAEARLLNATLKEAMRLYPPSSATFSRRALRDVRIGDLAIAGGALVVVPIWSLHRDSRWFPDPDAFRPDRFMPGAPAIPRGAFMPFGAGPHFCLGQQFAMVEMAMIAALMIRRFDLSFEPGAALPAPTVDLVLKPATRLRLRFTRRE